MTDSASESVLVVPTAVFERAGTFQGVCTEIDNYLNELLRPEHFSFRPRLQVEDDKNFKQLIPYVILRHAARRGDSDVFQYTRGRGQGEARLRALRSIGVGGHISEADALSGTGKDAFERGLQREIEEEVDIKSPYLQRCVGLINDDSNSVGQVHLGVVFVFDLERPAVTPRDPEMLASSFVSTTELIGRKAEFEAWSQICLSEILSALDS